MFGLLQQSRRIVGIFITELAPMMTKRHTYCVRSQQPLAAYHYQLAITCTIKIYIRKGLLYQVNNPQELSIIIKRVELSGWISVSIQPGKSGSGQGKQLNHIKFAKHPFSISSITTTFPGDFCLTQQTVYGILIPVIAN